MNDLHRIVYVSRNDLDHDDPRLANDLEQILTASRRNNAAVGVTGALMYHRNCFAQVLEGTHDAISTVFERIQCDERHSRIELLSFEPVKRRRFADWSMAYTGPVDTALPYFDHFLASDRDAISYFTGQDVEALIHHRLLAAHAVA